MNQYFPINGDFVEAILFDVLGGTIYQFPLQSGLSELESLHADLPAALTHYAVLVPSAWLAQTPSEVTSRLFSLNIIEMVLQLSDANTSILVLSRLKQDKRVLLCSLAMQQLDDLLVSKVVGSYRRAHARPQAASSASSPVCYASLFPEPSTGLMVDNLAFVADQEEFAQHDFSLNPQDYL